VVAELLLFCSRKELHPAYGNCICCTDNEDIPSQTLWQLLSFLTIQYTRRASVVDDRNADPSGASELHPNPSSLPRPPRVHFSVGQFRIERQPQGCFLLFESDERGPDLEPVKFERSRAGRVFHSATQPSNTLKKTRNKQNMWHFANHLEHQHALN